MKVVSGGELWLLMLGSVQYSVRSLASIERYELITTSGGFTVLATKAISTLLTEEWVNIFADWITYPVLAVASI